MVGPEIIEHLLRADSIQHISSAGVGYANNTFAQPLAIHVLTVVTGVLNWAYQVIAILSRPLQSQSLVVDDPVFQGVEL